ncbi:MAG: serine hydrolase [Gemmatimonadales bacterium]
MTVRRVGGFLWLAVGGLGTVAGPAVGQQRAGSSGLVPTREIDSLLARVIADWKVPGVAVGVVSDGRVVLATGSGYRDLERRLPVTPRTMFGIGSNTKSFTGLLAAMLVADGRLSWSEPVRRYLPEFELADPVATRLATLPDLLTHMTGLPRHDGLWYGRSWPRSEILGRLRHLEPSATFRAKWQYNNLMFLTAGMVAERVTGQTWDDLVERRILTPVGMAATKTRYRDQLTTSERALTYELRDGTIEPVPLRDADNIGPAGSIGSTVEDMLKYVQMYLDNGFVGGKPVIPTPALKAVLTPHVMMGVDIAAPESDFPELGIRVYGLGLAKTYYRGELMVLHGGGIDGYTSQMTWMPARKLGIVVLTNSTSPASEILTYSLYDRLLGLGPVDWNGRLLKSMTGPPGGPPVPATPGAPSHGLADYTGRFEHPGYGTIDVRERNGRLELTWDRFTTSLEHWRYDTFRSGAEAKRWGIIPNLASFAATFRTAVDGQVDQVEIPFEPAVAPIVFRRPN